MLEPNACSYYNKIWRDSGSARRDKEGSMAAYFGEYPRWCKAWKLPEKRREWLEYVLGNGMSYRDIARALARSGSPISKSSVGRYSLWKRGG